jgi:hypothetical protein
MFINIRDKTIWESVHQTREDRSSFPQGYLPDGVDPMLFTQSEKGNAEGEKRRQDTAPNPFRNLHLAL